MKSILRLQKLCFYIVITFLAQSVVFFGDVSAQSISDIDLKSINVESLTDAQILEYIKKAEARGLGEAEVEALARQKGMPESEILKLKTRIRSLRLQTSTGTNTQAVVTSLPLQSSSPSVPFGRLGGGETETLTSEERRIFGIDLFRRENLSFSPEINLPTPVNYILGPGDEIIVDLWGDTQQLLRFSVSRDGTIKPDRLGPIYVNGLTIETAEQKIIQRLSQIYSGLKGKAEERTIFHQVSLGNIRTINIEIIGAVDQPGVYSLTSLATVYYALHASGGPSSLGSFRDIRVVRNGKVLTSVDVYTFLTTGVKSGDVRLSNGDVIIIPPYQTRVTLDGQVKSPAIYELKAGESLDDLLKYANGFTDLAYKSVLSVRRNGDKERELLDIASDDFSDFKPLNGDLIEVSRILNRFSNRVAIDGAVFRAGEYELTEGMTVRALIEKAEGLRGDAFLDRATVYRTGTDYSQSILAIDIKGILKGTAPDIKLENEDLLVVNSIYDLGEEYSVQITGEVLEEGIYPFFKQMTVQDLVILAGGFKESASKAQIEISRRNNNNDINVASEIISISLGEDFSLALEDRNIMIRPFDQVFVRKSIGYSVQESVTVEGEVMAPGTYVIGEKDERISDIIKRAKGLTPYSFAKGAILLRRTEFSGQSSSVFVDQKSLRDLREKILLSQSELKNSTRSDLLNRVAKLKVLGSIEVDADIQGGDLKRKLIEDGDSSNVNLNIGGIEPLALKLDEILKTPGGKEDLIIRPGDVISIPLKLETVRVAGEVTSPLSFTYDEDFGFKDYINRSGGFLQSAKINRSYVQYPNGERRGIKRFLWFKRFPKIEPGSTIVVTRKPERARVDFQTIVGSVTSLATLALIIDRVRN